MICCPSCETENPPSRETCIGKRVESIGAGIAGGLLSGACLAFALLSQNRTP